MTRGPIPPAWQLYHLVVTLVVDTRVEETAVEPPSACPPHVETAQRLDIWLFVARFLDLSLFTVIIIIQLSFIFVRLEFSILSVIIIIIFDLSIITLSVYILIVQLHLLLVEVCLHLLLVAERCNHDGASHTLTIHNLLP